MATTKPETKQADVPQPWATSTSVDPDKVKVLVKKLNEFAVIPQYATEGSACFDITALDVKSTSQNENSITYSTGLSFEVPENHVMLVFSRSGHGFKENVRLANCVGVIDSDYRGELFVKLVKDNNSAIIQPSRGERVAQALVLPITQVSFEEVEQLSETVRGENGLGSTGA